MGWWQDISLHILGGELNQFPVQASWTYCIASLMATKLQNIDWPLSHAEAKHNPEESANIISKLFFTYVNSLIKLGSLKHLEQDDLWELLPKVRLHDRLFRLQEIVIEGFLVPKII